MNLFGLWRQNCSVFVSWSRPSSWSWDSRGEIHFPRTPISYSVPGFHFPWVAPFPPAAEDFVLLTCPPAAANSSPPASRAAAEGLRSAAFTFVALAPRCPLRLPPNRAVRSHPLRGAYRAFFAGRQCCFVSHTRYYAQPRLCGGAPTANPVRAKFLCFMLHSMVCPADLRETGQ